MNRSSHSKDERVRSKPGAPQCKTGRKRQYFGDTRGIFGAHEFGVIADRTGLGSRGYMNGSPL